MMVDTDYGEKQSDTTEQTDHGNDATEQTDYESDITKQTDHGSDTTEQIDHGDKVDQEKQETTFLQVTRTQKITLLMKAGKIMPP